VTTQWGDAGSSGAFYVSLSSATINTNSRQAFIAINLSLYRSLRVTYYFTTTANQWANAGMYLHTSSYYAYYTIAKPASYPQYWTRQARITGGTTSGTVTWDVSGLSGTYYLLCGCYLEASITSGMTARIDQVVGIS
jgi:hypothetical protein